MPHARVTIKSVRANGLAANLREMIKNSKQDSGNKMKNFLDYAYIAIDTYTKKIL